MKSDFRTELARACDDVGIRVPGAIKPGVWIKSAVIGKKASNQSGRVLIFDDLRGGIVHNWATGQQCKFHVDGIHTLTKAERFDIQKRKHDRDQRLREEQQAVEQICRTIVENCEITEHGYFERKGFPEERGLVIDDPRRCLPSSKIGDMIAHSLEEMTGPLLIVPGRLGKTIKTVQFITVDGVKKNILRGQMTASSHRIATGRETWICEGIATALTVRAVLRGLGRSATVLSAFSASNVAKVAEAYPEAIIAADNDNPVEQFNGLGTGEYYARRSGRAWLMPPERGDFNDFHMSQGLRSVMLFVRGAMN